MLEINQTLNNTYKIIEKLGSGGGGIVYKAYHLRLEKYVAVKLIKDNVKGVINERAEADILKRLKHEGLPQVFDFVSDGEDVYTVMEFIDGCSLFDEIVKWGKIPYKQALEWSKELCSAAAYLHTRKPPIIHSDIKPQNIMLTSEGKLCLIDFNISSVFGGGVYTVGSSDGYSPPEQYIVKAEKMRAVRSADNDTTEILDDDKTEILSETDSGGSGERHTVDKTILDTRSDVYSIGAVMYSMVTGMKPCNSRKNVKPLKKIDENIPDSLVYIIEKAMSKDKEKRFSSAEEMLKVLNNINKLDKRYKRMALSQQLAFILCLILMAGSAVSVIAGHRLMQTESADKLSGYISELQGISESGDYSRFDEIFAAVTEEFPESAEPHFYKAFMLYKNNDYQGAEEYISGNLLDNISSLSPKSQSDTYMMLADMLFKQEKYSEAAAYYENAISYNPESADIYRDYAISLAKLGDTDRADEIMQLAIKHGLTEDGVYMVTGEIQFKRGEYEEAIRSLKKGISITNDDTLKRNAYLVCSNAYKEMYGAGNEEIMLADISLLEQSIIDVPAEMSMQLRENLAQVYIDYGEFSGRTEYYAKAVTLLDDMRALNSVKNYQTDMNIAVLCDRIGNSYGCKSILLEMSQVPEYEPYYFTIYTRLAYCEAGIQGDTDVKERDYSEFDVYYNKAVEAYKVYTESGKSDPEMDKLNQLRAEMVSLGWLD